MNNGTIVTTFAINMTRNKNDQSMIFQNYNTAITYRQQQEKSSFVTAHIQYTSTHSIHFYLIQTNRHTLNSRKSQPYWQTRSNTNFYQYSIPTIRTYICKYVARVCMLQHKNQVQKQRQYKYIGHSIKQTNSNKNNLLKYRISNFDIRIIVIIIVKQYNNQVIRKQLNLKQLNCFAKTIDKHVTSCTYQHKMLNRRHLIDSFNILAKKIQTIKKYKKASKSCENAVPKYYHEQSQVIRKQLNLKQLNCLLRLLINMQLAAHTNTKCQTDVI
eukprot:TRINITY_DN17298_c0_g1_i3.p1 TRINITY_DN17298_c0_g1~~TRINITY_DN17298_c0_g1_i3.p1  ORF type:complete len:271 (-),score=-15.81 TRINITY_DN17298_c0_g1_i3:224-1036(-)